MAYNDILLFVALPEEEFLFNKEFTWESKIFNEVKRTKYIDGTGKEIGISFYNLNGMGSVAAAINGRRIIEQTNPKCVLLVGIAAAYKESNQQTEQTIQVQDDSFNHGDVGYNRDIYNSSFGKIEDGQIFHKVRGTPITRCEFFKDSWIQNDVISKNAWEQKAVQWLGLHSEWRNIYRMPEQSTLYIKGGPKAIPTDIASGELVVKSENFKKHIISSFPAAKIRMFEMEAYAISSICQSLGISFLTIRGISDYGDPEKNDQYRFIAISAATAFSLSLIRDGIGNRIESIQIRRILSNPPCLDPQGPAPCRYPLIRLELPIRKQVTHECIHFGLDFVSGHSSWLTRVYDDVRSSDYSLQLSNILPHFIDDENFSVVFLFPYSAFDLLDFLSSQHTDVNFKKEIEKLKTIIKDITKSRKRNWSTLSNSEKTDIVSLIRSIAEYSKNTYSHFIKCDHICRSLSETEDGLAKLKNRVSRIILLKKKEYDNVENTPINLLYEYFLGRNTPTYLASADENIPYDDIVFLEMRNPLELSNPIENRIHDGAVSLAVRYFLKSNTLLLTGLPCKDSNIPDKPNMFQQYEHIKLFKSMNEHGKENNFKFKEFPFHSISEKYSAS
jgi:nucleoside phosphorylase